MNKLAKKMIMYYAGDPLRIQHFIKVHSFSKLIGELEGLDEKTRFILETAAYVHDIGIKPAEEKYGSDEGPLQEKEGVPVAEAMLRELEYEEDVIQRVCYLVGHHHTYTDIDGMDYQILVEADFLVNMFEGEYSKESVKNTYENIFKSKAGKEICREMFGL